MFLRAECPRLEKSWLPKSKTKTKDIKGLGMSSLFLSSFLHFFSVLLRQAHFLKFEISFVFQLLTLWKGHIILSTRPHFNVSWALELFLMNVPRVLTIDPREYRDFLCFCLQKRKFQLAVIDNFVMCLQNKWTSCIRAMNDDYIFAGYNLFPPRQRHVRLRSGPGCHIPLEGYR